MRNPPLHPQAGQTKDHEQQCLQFYLFKLFCLYGRTRETDVIRMCELIIPVGVLLNILISCGNYLNKSWAKLYRLFLHTGQV